MKRLLSITIATLLVLLVCFFALPENVQAAEATSGTCGDDLTWTFDSAGVLTISGTGPMTDYKKGKTPWYGFKDEIYSVVIEEGVTTIGTYSLEYLKNMTSISIANTVTTIRPCALSFCLALEDITIPSSVTTIEAYAFESCRALTDVTIPDNVTSLGAFSLYDCTGLKKVTLGKGITEINNRTFWYCTSLVDVTIPTSVTKLGGSVFYDCSALTEITIPSSVTELGTQVFYGCSNLKLVEIFGQIQSLPTYTFFGCNNLKELFIPASLTYFAQGAVPNGPETNIYFGGTSEQFWQIAYGGFTAKLHYNCTDARNHWENKVVPATCTADGYTCKSCACGKVLDKVVTETATGHDWDNGVVTKEPAVGQEGEKTFTCGNCNETKTEPIEALAPPIPAVLDNVGIYKTTGHLTGNILYWSPVAHGDIYQVFRLNGSSWELLTNTRSLAYKDETAPAGVKSYYKIVARNGASKSDISTTRSAYETRPLPTPTKLDNVTITSINAHTSGNILYWNAVTNAKIYQVYRLDNGSWTLLTNTGSTAYKDETAPVSVKTYYKIVARNGDIKSDIATTASASATRPAVAITKLDNVTITNIVAHKTGNIIYWNAVNNAKIYQVYRLENGSWVLLKNTGSTAYKDETAPVGVKCYYKIVARNGDIKSDIATTTSASAIRPKG